MPKLVVNPGSPASWAIDLKPGTNSVGRGFSNDFRIEDPSVSSSHCQIVLNDGAAFIKDLGSTNGTYIDRAPIAEAYLQPGQTIHLGGVELLFQPDEAAYSATAVPTAPALPTSSRFRAAPVLAAPPPATVS